MNRENIAGEGQFLTFRLGEEVYALEITRVREVLDYTAITRVPRTPEFMKGVINLRGGVVPVIDLRLKFGMSQTVKTVNTCIIIVEITIDEEKTLLGALADSVQEVITLDDAQIEPPPRLGSRINTEFLRGMGKQNEDFIMIINIDRVFSVEELSDLLEHGVSEGEVEEIGTISED